MLITEFGMAIIETHYMKRSIRMERVHGFWILIFTFCCFLIASTVNATPIVRLEQSATDILVGEDVIISVFADGVTETDFFSGLPDEVLSFGFQMTLPSLQILMLQGMFSQGSAETIFY